VSVFRQTAVVKFAWCDFAGIMFFPRYFELCNDTVEAWFAEALGVSFRKLHGDLNLSVPTARMEADFRAASRMDDKLDIALTVERLGGASCAIRIRVTCRGEERFEARQIIVMTDRETLKSRRWPDSFRQKMLPYVEAD